MYKLQHTEDKFREVIHSENAIIKIEELDFSLVNTSNSQITTVQGLIQRVASELNLRKDVDQSA